MSEIIKKQLRENISKRIKIIMTNDYIYRGNLEEVDEDFVSIKLDNSVDIKIIRIDVIKEVIIYGGAE